MDKIDRAIIKLLQKNAKISNADMGKELNMAPSAVWERVKKLEESGIITKYSAIIDPKALDLTVVAFVMLSVQGANWSEKSSQALKQIGNISELHEVLGEDSYIAKVRVRNVEELSTLLKDKIGQIPEIKSTKTIMVVKSVKEECFYEENNN